MAEDVPQFVESHRWDLNEYRGAQRPELGAVGFRRV
jgi:hypothetical protein